MTFFKKNSFIKQEMKLAEDLFSLIEQYQHSDNTNALILPTYRQYYDDLKRQPQSQPERLLNTIASLMKIVDPSGQEGLQLYNLLILLKKRIAVYQKAEPYEKRQYFSFLIHVSKSLEHETSNAKIDRITTSYFGNRHYLPVAHHVIGIKDHQDNSSDFLPKSTTLLKTAKICIGLGLSCLALGGAAFAFCPVIALFAIPMGLVMIGMAAYYLASPQVPNSEAIKHDENEIFKCIRDIKSLQPQEYDQGTKRDSIFAPT